MLVLCNLRLSNDKLDKPIDINLLFAVDLFGIERRTHIQLLIEGTSVCINNDTASLIWGTISKGCLLGLRVEPNTIPALQEMQFSASYLENITLLVQKRTTGSSRS